MQSFNDFIYHSRLLPPCNECWESYYFSLADTRWRIFLGREICYIKNYSVFFLLLFGISMGWMVLLCRSILRCIIERIVLYRNIYMTFMVRIISYHEHRCAYFIRPPSSRMINDQEIKSNDRSILRDKTSWA